MGTTVLRHIQHCNTDFITVMRNFTKQKLFKITLSNSTRLLKVHMYTCTGMKYCMMFKIVMLKWFILADWHTNHFAFFFIGQPNYFPPWSGKSFLYSHFIGKFKKKIFHAHNTDLQIFIKVSYVIMKRAISLGKLYKQCIYWMNMAIILCFLQKEKALFH